MEDNLTLEHSLKGIVIPPVAWEELTSSMRWLLQLTDAEKVRSDWRRYRNGKDALVPPLAQVYANFLIAGINGAFSMEEVSEEANKLLIDLVERHQSLNLSPIEGPLAMDRNEIAQFAKSIAKEAFIKGYHTAATSRSENRDGSVRLNPDENEIADEVTDNYYIAGLVNRALSRKYEPAR